MALKTFHPEMNEPRPEATIEGRLSHYGRHYFVRSKDELPGGRGVEYLGQLTAGQLVPGSRLVGWHEYKMTTRAFDALCERADVVVELLL